MEAQSSSFLYFLLKYSFRVPEGDALGVLIRLSSRRDSESEGECDRLLTWLFSWLPKELGVSSAINLRRLGSVGRSMKPASRFKEQLLPNLVLSSDGDGDGVDLSNEARCCISKFSLLGDQDLFDRLIINFSDLGSLEISNQSQSKRSEFSYQIWWALNLLPIPLTPYQQCDKEQYRSCVPWL